MTAVVIEVRGLRDAALKVHRLRNWKVGLPRLIGDLLKRQHERRIETEKTAPDGTPWKELSPTTLAIKRARGARSPESILIDTHAMAGNFRVTTGGDIIRLRNPTPYTIRHMEGTRFMVKRPFLGISNPNVQEIRRLVERHIARVMSNNLSTLVSGE